MDNLNPEFKKILSRAFWKNAIWSFLSYKAESELRAESLNKVPFKASFKEQLNKWLFFNFRIHILTPLVFMFGLCCTRICPYCGYCAYWNFLKKAMDNWTRRTRMIICSLVAFPLAISMITVGAISIEQCSKEVNNSSSLTTGIVVKLQ